MSIEHPENHLYPDSIILRKFIGKVNADEIISSWEELERQDKFTSKIKGVLNDLEDCELTVGLDGFKRVIDFMKQKDYLLNLKLAVVTSSANNIVFPTLGQSHVKELKIKPFSTIEAAVYWILE